MTSPFKIGAKMDNKYLNELDVAVDVTLKSGVNVSGTKVTTLRMRELTVADQEAASSAQGSDSTREIILFANLCQITPEEVRSMTMRDYKRLQAAYLSFLD